MKHARPIVPIALVTVAALAVTAACGHHDAELAPSSFEPVTVRTTTVERVTSRQPIEVRGTVQPGREAFVSSRVMGPVTAIWVEPGSRISQGQQLLQIQPAASDGQLAQASGALSQAKAALALTERNYRRFQALHEQNAASDLELDMARMEFERAQGAVAQAEGAVQSAGTVADDSLVRAPFAGRVVDTLVEIGDMAAPGRPLVRVQSTTGQQIWLVVREADIGRLSPGQQISMTIDARPDLGTVEGPVEEIVPSADPATHTFMVKVGLPGVVLPSGLAGRAQIPGDEEVRLVVPASAIHRRGGLELVVVRAQDGAARTRAVTTGRSLPDNRIEILSGLDEGDVVAIDAPGPVADGTPLEVA
jgi:RND family efflux transporter MFP subunit